jgi:hypothetical protein
MQKLTVEEILAAPWWSDFLKLKDTWSWSALESRFDVRQSFLRNALAAAGLTKPPQPPGRKPKGWAGYGADTPAAEPAAPAAAVPAPNDGPPTEALALLGKAPDGAVATKLGVTADVVKRWRREAGIDPFLQAPPGRASKAQKRPESVVVRKDRARSSVVRTERHAPAVEVVAPPPVAPAPPKRGRPPAAARAQASSRPAKSAPAKPAAKVVSGTGRGRASALDRFREHIGQLTDGQVAAMAGVTPAAVTQYRRRRDIPAANRRTLESVAGEAAVGAVSAPTVAAAPVALPVLAAPPATPEQVPSAPVTPVSKVAPATDAPVDAAAREREADLSPAAPVAPAPEIELVVPALPGSASEQGTPEAALPAPAKAGPAFGWKVKARNPVGEQVFVVLGTHIADAVARACASLQSRADGPWEFVSARRWVNALD